MVISNEVSDFMAILDECLDLDTGMSVWRWAINMPTRHVRDRLFHFKTRKI